MNFYAIIVIYNKSFKDSITYDCVANCNRDNLKVIVCDNSVKDFNNSQCANEKVTYINMGGNKGISKAYNRAIDSIKDDDGYLCLFDDDTKIPENYFDVLEAEIDRTKSDIYLPLVHDEVGIMSPCKLIGPITYRITEYNELNQENIAGINSGMAIKLDIFNHYRYNERYFLDYIDFAFIRDMKSLNKVISFIPDIEINQRFSGNDMTNYEGAKTRYNIFKKDFYYFCSQNPKDKLFAIIHLSKRWAVVNIYIKHYKFLSKLLGKNK